MPPNQVALGRARPLLAGASLPTENNQTFGSSGMWCLRMWCLIIIVLRPHIS